MARLLKIATFLVLLIATAVFADVVILEFKAEPSLDKITLRWKTGQETGAKQFIVERSTNNRDFVPAGEVAAKGSNSDYEFVDDRLASVNNIYYYRLKIVNTDNSTQLSESIQVMPKISSFAKTWGSIKALFQ